MKKLLSITLVFLACITASQAQTKDEIKYRKASEEVKKQVWAWDMPQFHAREIPQEFASASKVVLAQHTELTADSKSKLQFDVLTILNVNKEETITEVVRELVKLNDKSAVSDYSELNFTKFEKSSGFYSRDKSMTFVGVRVIKPNGEVKELESDEMVLTKDLKSEKKAKIAVPDLEPGDIIDYFIATEQTITNDYTTKAYRIILFDDAPVLHLSFHAQLGKKYALEYRSYNGAPKLEVNKNAADEIVIDVEKTGIPAYETALWVAPAAQLPYIRLNISLGYTGIGSKYLPLKKPGEISSPNSEEVMESLAALYSQLYHSRYWPKPMRADFVAIEKDAKRMAKQAGVDYDVMSDDEKAAHLFYTMRFTRFLNFDIDHLQTTINSGFLQFNGLPFPLFSLMKSAGLKPAILVSAAHGGVKYEEILDKNDLIATAYLPSSGKMLNFASIFDIPFQVPEAIEGMKKTGSFTFAHPNAVPPAKVFQLTIQSPGIQVPITKADENAHIERLKLSLSPANDLNVERKTTLKGLYKTPAQRQLVLYEDFYESERKAMGETKSLLDGLEENKKTKKHVEEVKNALAEARKKQKESFEKEATDWFEQEVNNIKDFKVENLGVRHTAPDFIYSSSFNLSGMIKQANENYIVEVGKITGSPIVIKEEQRKRDIDVYMPFARSIEYEIELEIPEGYSVEGVGALNKNVRNETGFFIAEATATESSVLLKVKKHYLTNFVAAKDWQKIVAFTDAANDWTNAQVLLKKKQ